MPVHSVPFPCAVYSRERSVEPYAFSHYCVGKVQKAFPASLRVADLRDHAPGGNLACLRRACFLVLAAGARAQAVSVANAQDRRTHFLYSGAPASRPIAWPARSEEIEDGFVPLVFCSTLASFRRGALDSVVPMECGMIVLPSRLRERDLPRIARWVEHQLARCLRGSVWVTEAGSFNEATLRARAHQPKPPVGGQRDAGQPRQEDGVQARDGVRPQGVGQAVLA